MSELENLLETVKAATGPDREIDHTIEAKLREYVGGMTFGVYETAEEWLPVAIKRNFNSPRYTSSIDAALALVERCLPEMWWSFRFSSDAGDLDCDDRCVCELNLHQDRGSERDVIARHVTHPLAILAALLAALIAQAEG